MTAAAAALADLLRGGGLSGGGLSGGSLSGGGLSRGGLSRGGLIPGDVAAELVSSARFVFCTCCVSGSFLVRGMGAPCWLIIDEAAQASEPEAIVAIGSGAARAVLAGDARQLAYAVRSAEGREAHLDESIMGRLSDRLSHPVSFLSLQHRMHPAIAAFPSRHFYGGSLHDAPCVADAESFAPWVRRAGQSWAGPSSLIHVPNGSECRLGVRPCYPSPTPPHPTPTPSEPIHLDGP